MIILEDLNLAVLPPYRTNKMCAQVNKINLTDLYCRSLLQPPNHQIKSTANISGYTVYTAYLTQLFSFNFNIIIVIQTTL